MNSWKVETSENFIFEVLKDYRFSVGKKMKSFYDAINIKKGREYE